MNITRIFFSWFPFAVTVTFAAGLVYATVQQNFRSSANDPQIQVAEDLSAQLAQGGNPQPLNFAPKIDMAKSLATYVIVFDDQSAPIAGTVTLNGKIPVPPKGVFDFARKNGEDRLTWQPQPDVRNAIILRHFSGAASGFVLAGRSIREVEKREQWLSIMTLIAWIVMLLGTLVAVLMRKLMIQ